MLLLAADFYYLKNIAGRRLVGLRWWNEVDTGTGDSHWVFESQDRSGGDGGVVQNATDKRYVCRFVLLGWGFWGVGGKGGGGRGVWDGVGGIAGCERRRGRNGANVWDYRFFWLALYAQPGLWIGLAIFAIVKFEFTWLILVGESVPLSCFVIMGKHSFL